MKGVAARALTIAAILGFVALGIWQLERRTWKLALIERVDAKLAAAPVAAPPASKTLTEDDAYTRVTASGRYLPGHDVYVQALTALGGGYWVMTPLDTANGRILINRGFVPADMRGRAPPAAGPATVTGLIRLSEPGGGFLRSNDPAAGRWYSRDVAAIAAAQRLGAVAPWFIDAGPNGSDWPRGGLTVVAFRNAHLSYGLTWFAMAALLAVLAWRAMRKRAR
ncbi:MULTISPECIES: SURF1 family protein [unclassified Sphingomonas]|uniref:SURF1 family protein n=1 Tax=unclassified Sphingomonas TaxID=196159 RepID=UPI00092831A9|nr:MULTISPECIES: SURF1 family protein [unclassified Sphingomonas]OJU20949.1 MAG: Surfeit locus 1 family protein [Sphingomonas sp. 66-10]